MKNMKKLKILTAITAIVMLTQFSNFALAIDLNETKLAKENSKQLLIETNEKLYFENVSASLDQLAKIKKSSSELQDYDVYIDDNGILNIMVYDDTQKSVAFNTELEPTTAKLKKYASVLKDENVIYKKVKFSSSYLKNIQRIVTENMKELGVESVGSGNNDNKVDIGLSDITKKENVISLLKNNIDDFDISSVIFTQINDIEPVAHRSYPGRRVYRTEKIGDAYTIYNGSSGFNAKDKSTGQYGVVTAGHLAFTNQSIYNANDTKIGKVTHRKKADSIDACFAPFEDDFAPSMAIDGNTNRQIKNYVKVADIVRGMPVAKHGITTNRTTGTVLDTAYNTSTITRLIRSSCYVDSGDSGGPLYLTSASGGYSANSVLGISTMRLTENNVISTLSTKAGFIIATFGLELYTG